MSALGDRIVVLIDMDCFFCQVETKLQPEYEGKPLAVVQYNNNLWKSGGIIAVNYEAREFGVTRHMRGDEAKEKCPEIVLAVVPAQRGKADTSRYRSAGREIIEVMKKHCNTIERASVDEAYLDITQIVDNRISSKALTRNELIQHLKNTYVVGYSETGVNDEDKRSKSIQEWINSSSDELDDIQVKRLAVAGIVVEEIRADIYEKTKYRCSAGISFNKILAKLACGLHKPNRQTILPVAAVPELFATLPIKKVRNLGGKFGDIVIESLKCNVMADLLQYTLQYLQGRFENKTGLWLYNIARGIDDEPVTSRLIANSIGSCKKFPGKQAITKPDVLRHWVDDLTAEVCERLKQDAEENERRATLLTISYQFYQKDSIVAQSRSTHLNSYKHEKVSQQCFDILNKSTQLPIAFIGFSAGKFIGAKESESFVNFFKSNGTKLAQSKDPDKNDVKLCPPVESNESHEEKFKETNKSSPRIVPQKEIRSFFKTINNIETPPGKKTRTRRTQIATPNTSINDDSVLSSKLKKSFFANMLKEKEEDTSDSKTTEEMIAEMPGATANADADIAVKLQDIFPDLNDIDPSILSCLPMQLQKEASELLKNKNPVQKTTDSPIKKTRKSKNSKSNVQKQTNCINSFLIKASVNGESEAFQTCSQCGQSISTEKRAEHEDFHVAQSLQKMMCKTASGKRESDQNNSDVSSKKRLIGKN